MNTKTRWVTFGGLIALAWIATAQQVEVPAADEDQPQPAVFFEPPPANAPPDSPVFLWMQRLRQRNPEMCRRLERMRTENPEMFHFRVRRLMEKERVQMILRNYPTIREALEALPLEQQEAFYEEIAGLAGPPSRAQSGRPKMRMGPRPEPEHAQPTCGRGGRPAEGPVFENWPRVRELRQRYAAAKTPDEQKTIRAETRRAIEAWLDQRAAHHEQRLQQIEAEIARLKQLFHETRERKEQVRERLLERILTGAPSQPSADASSPAPTSPREYEPKE